MSVSKMLSQGVHVAPFLSREGQLVLLSIDVGSTFRGMASVTAAEGSNSDVIPMAARDLRYSVDSGRTFVSHDGEPPRASEHLQLWRRGVYRAPWTRGMGRPEWLCIDRRGRLVASTVRSVATAEALLEGDAAAAESVERQEIESMRALLDTLDPQPAVV